MYFKVNALISILASTFSQLQNAKIIFLTLLKGLIQLFGKDKNFSQLANLLFVSFGHT